MDKPAQIAARIGVTPRRVSNWVSGQRSPNVAEVAALRAALPEVDARAFIAELAARWRAKH